ncbi:patatin [Scytonema sp. UIC 10036]|uniref:patatin-like phospholipase family protein n=1 Tax=Scytonema sp. UIC 10036 TaxID=2304196 RepID=UPI0012DAE877|nr:patatin-like phospholipase family protein [Scytonema sp. UIC 10036]MUG91424.1 patatin [Scytonema sp. UIC 10036]
MPFRILSLDGGGIRGVIAAKMLAAIEKRIDQPLNEYFNLIAGTSTGAILATAIAIGRSSEEIVELYKQKSSAIFPYRSRFSLARIPLILQYGLSAPKFSDDGLIQVLKQAFGKTRLFDVLSPLLLILSYDTITRKPIIFKSWRQDKDYENVPLWEACVCSASAPTYFPAHKLDKKVNGIVQNASAYTVKLDENASKVDDVYNNTNIFITRGTGGGQARTLVKYEGFTRIAKINQPWDVIPDNTSTYLINFLYSAIDGGVAANNPSASAVAEALRLGYAIEDITVLSIGTGDRTRIIPYKQARESGLIEWAQPLIGVLFDASSDVYEYIANQIMHNRLLRLQFKLDRQLTGQRLSDDIDDATQENINNLIEAAEVYINQQQVQKKLQEFLQMS